MERITLLNTPHMSQSADLRPMKLICSSVTQSIFYKCHSDQPVRRLRHYPCSCTWVRRCPIPAAECASDPVSAFGPGSQIDRWIGGHVQRLLPICQGEVSFSSNLRSYSRRYSDCWRRSQKDFCDLDLAQRSLPPVEVHADRVC